MKRKLRLHYRQTEMPRISAVELYAGYAGEGIGVLLESYDEGYDRFTVIAREPEETITSEGAGLLIRKRSGDAERLSGNPLALLKSYYADFEIEKDPSYTGFCGGLVGNLGYDFIRYVEKLPDDNPDPIGIETVQMFLVTQFFLIDQIQKQLFAVVLAEDTEDAGIAAETACEKMLQEAARIKPQQETSFQPDGRVTGHTDDLKSYSEKVEKIRHYIREGHIFQTVLSQRWEMETAHDGLAIYRALKELNPSPYLYYFRYDTFEVIGSSPEMIVKQRGRTVSTCPIAGTRPRGKTKEEDARFHEELLQDEKELAEHVMLVDLARNDMGRIAKFGSVRVSEFMKIKDYSHVMHIVSLVEGEKNADDHPFDLVASFLPAGTLSGAPKIRAMEIIDELETVRRGLYGGATGYIDFGGDMDFCITIRTIVKKGKKAYVQAGAGIVADSVPEKEYMECANKAMALAKTILRDTNEMIFT